MVKTPFLMWLNCILKLPILLFQTIKDSLVKKYLFVFICIGSFFSAKETDFLFNHVKGMAIEYNNKLYTLNFKQQNRVIQILNCADLYSKNGSKVDASLEKNGFDYNRLIIYRFEEPDLEVIPAGHELGDVIFELKDQNSSG